jgi:hypothetical protein
MTASNPDAIALAVLDEPTNAQAILCMRGCHMITQNLATGNVRKLLEAENRALLALCSRLNPEATKDALAALGEWDED